MRRGAAPLDETSLRILAVLDDPKVRKTVAWWRQARAWGLDWLEQDDVLMRAAKKTAAGHRPDHPSGQHVNTSFSFFLDKETSRELKRKLSPKRRAERLPEGDEGAGLPAPSPAPPDRDPDGAGERVWRWAARYLPAGERDLVLAVFRDGRTHKEAAAAAGLSPETVALRLRFALSRLRAVAEEGGWSHPHDPCD